MKQELVITKDGSHTIFIPELHEHYHSINGAIEEALHVFIHTGLQHFLENNHEINILEIGFGTGLNAILTEHFSKQHPHAIHYTAIEAFPLSQEIIQQLNYTTFEIIDQELFLKLHQSSWDEMFHEIRQNFFLKKIPIMVENYSVSKNNFHLIYFDAFAPDIQPVLWEKQLFEKLYDSLQIGGILTTYSAKGEVRRNMQSVGFKVERLPGALGKREMLKATKI